jgi:putative transposase
LFFLHDVKRSHVTIWKWIQKRHFRKTSSKRRTIEGFIVDETLLKVGPESIWLWIATVEPESHQILAQTIIHERNMFVAERFRSGVVKD